MRGDVPGTPSLEHSAPMFTVYGFLAAVGICLIGWWLVTLLSGDSVLKFLERLTTMRDSGRAAAASLTARLCGVVAVDTPSGEIVLWSRERSSLAQLAGVIARSGNRRHCRGNDLARVGRSLPEPVYMVRIHEAVSTTTVHKWWRDTNGQPVLVDDKGERDVGGETFALIRRAQVPADLDRRAALLAQMSAQAGAVAGSDGDAPAGPDRGSDAMSALDGARPLTPPPSSPTSAAESRAPPDTTRAATNEAANGVGEFIAIPDELLPVGRGRSGTKAGDETQFPDLKEAED